MAIAYNTDIVKSNLVLYLDAANPKSYPRSGTTWSDLSGNGNNGTLTNGPTFNSNNGGSLLFDGSNDYTELSVRNTNLEFQPTQAFSIFCWLYNFTYTGNGAVVSNMLGSAPYSGWDLWRNGNTSIAGHLISTWSANAVKVQVNFDYAANANKWVYVGYTYNGTSPANATDALNSMNFYVNGLLTTAGKANSNADGFNTSSETLSYDSSQRFRIASRWAAGSWVEGGNLTISTVKIYNRALSFQEILQNFQSTRDRYGI